MKTYTFTEKEFKSFYRKNEANIENMFNKLEKNCKTPLNCDNMECIVKWLLIQKRENKNIPLDDVFGDKPMVKINLV